MPDETTAPPEDKNKILTMKDIVFDDIQSSDNLTEEEKKKAIDQISNLPQSLHDTKTSELIGTPLQGLFNWFNSPGGNAYWSNINRKVYYEKVSKDEQENHQG